MDEETKKAFKSIDKRSISLNDSINNFGGNIIRLTQDVSEIKTNILQNCSKLDNLSNDVKEIKEKLNDRG